MSTQTEQIVRSQTPVGGQKRLLRLRQVLLILAVSAIVLSRAYIPNIHYDRLNVIPLLATLYLGYALLAPNPMRTPVGNAAAGKPSGRSLASPWLRSILLLLVFLLAAEFGLRCLSYHRPLLYERQGDLLYTPTPNQEYVEKISLTPSQVNDYGLRGGPVTSSGKEIILCLGDSVTFGYGVDDQHTYPVELQKLLEQKYPNRFLVLNGGVDAYPIEFMRQKFLYLWKRGIHPDIVIVGYSFNEGGWLPHLLDSNDKARQQIAATVQMKNRVRSIALYNLLVENWGRTSYNRMKKYMVPASRPLSRDEALTVYRQHLQSLYDELNAHHVKSVFALFAGYDAGTRQYVTQGPFQIEFRSFAQTHALPLIQSDQVLSNPEPPTSDVQQYFQDQCHMTASGTERFGQALAEFLSRTSLSSPGTSW